MNLQNIKHRSEERPVSGQPAVLLSGTLQVRLPRLILRILPLLAILLVALMPLPVNAEPKTIQNVSETLNQVGSVGHMSRQLSSIFGIVILLVIPLILVMWLYNGIVGKEEKVMESWAQVEASYQRRADLIPALIEMVAKYMAHEQTTLNQVAEARANPQAEIDKLLQARKQAAELIQARQGKAPTDEAQLDEMATAQASMGISAKRLLAVAEAYPQLRASDQFLALQAQFEGTENRILTARNRFNEAVETYNSAIRKMPGSLVAGLGQFSRKAYFKADVSSAQTPERKWD